MEQNRIKLDFLKRILTDTAEEQVYNSFFVNGYPENEIMQKTIALPIDHPREEGLDWPERAHTMIGLKRLNNLHEMLDYVRENNLNGDLIETGVWRGGATIFMKSYINLYNMNKKVFVCDSFEGLPLPNLSKYPDDKGDTHHTVDFLKISLEIVKNNFRQYNLLDEKVIFLKGWFSDTLPNNHDIDKISLLRFDGDMYGSTIDVLESLYDKVVDDGVIIIDDYCLPNCAKAVSDFRNGRKIGHELKVVDRCGRFWFKK
jgi:O-methyltransferase